MRWTAEDLATAAGGRLVRRGERQIAGVFIDSRAPIVDGLFVPVVAARDGHEFIAAAIAGGAAAVLQTPGRAVPDGGCTVIEVEDTLVALTNLARAARASWSGPVVAITGSNGKTTTRAMVEAALRTKYSQVLATRGNFNNHLGVPLTLLNEPHTPDAAVIELGMSAPGENDLLAGIVQPDVAVITSVALEHLEFMGSIEAIAAAEAETVKHVRAGGVVVVPGDEPLLAPHVPAGALRFGRSCDATVQIVDVVQEARTLVTLRVRGETGTEDVQASLGLFGAHNARNAAAALTVGLHLGCSLPDMLAALATVEPVGDRGRVLQFGPHLIIADCYNANPGSVAAALHSLAELRRPGPLVAVLGDMLELGPDAPRLHAEVGELAARLRLDAVFTFGPLSQHTATAAQLGGIAAWHAGDSIDDLVAAVRARFGVRPGAVLIKGSRGMRLERVTQALVGSDAPV